MNIDTLNAYCRCVLVTHLPLCQGRLYNIHEVMSLLSLLCYPVSLGASGLSRGSKVFDLLTDSWVPRPGLGSARSPCESGRVAIPR